MEASCRIHPAHRTLGYAGEALGALLDWSTARYGVTRFLVAVATRRESGILTTVEIDIRRAGSVEAQLDHAALLRD